MENLFNYIFDDIYWECWKSDFWIFLTLHSCVAILLIILVGYILGVIKIDGPLNLIGPYPFHLFFM